MPYATSAATARTWATDRAIDLWTIFGEDLRGLPGGEPAAPSALRVAFDALRTDGARVAVLDDAATPATPAIGPRATNVGDALRVAGPPAPEPFAVFSAMRASGVADVRRVGILAAGPRALEAGHRAGCGAIVGLVVAGPGEAAARHALVRSQPDRIIAVEELGATLAPLYGSGRAHRERVLLNPGPAVVSDRVHRAIGGPDLCHREPEYNALFGRVTAKLRRVAGVDDGWATCLLGGSGTAAMEAMTGALVRPDRRLLVCRNGTYGERLATIAARLGIGTIVVDERDTIPIDPAAVAAALDAHPDIDAVAIVAHETTTGLLNPVAEVARAADTRGVPTVVDAISAFGSEDLPLAGSGIDIVAGTSNKNLHGLPGVAFLILSPRARARTADVAPRSLYFDIRNHLHAEAQGTVPFTPPIPAIYGLEAALDELFDEGLPNRRALYRARMAVLDEAFGRLDLHPVVAPEHRSGSVRSLPLPAGIDYDDLHDTLKADGYVIYAGLGSAAATSFRVCALGALDVDVMRGFARALETALARLGYRAPIAAS